MEFVDSKDEARIPKIKKRLSSNYHKKFSKIKIPENEYEYLFEAGDGDNLIKIALYPKTKDFPFADEIIINPDEPVEYSISLKPQQMSRNSQDLLGSFIDKLISLIPKNIRPDHVKEYGEFHPNKPVQFKKGWCLDHSNASLN